MTWRRLGTALLVAGIACAPARAPAQEQVVHHDEGERRLVSVRVAPFAGSARVGGQGFVYVDVQNQDARPHGVAIEFESRSWSGSNVDVRHVRVLGPHERDRFHLPLPGLPRYAFELRVTVDSTTYEESLQPSSNRGSVALVISDRSTVTAQVLELALGLWPVKKRDKPDVVGCVCNEAPADWRMFTAFDLVAVDGMSNVGRDLQDALRRFAHAGGRVLVIAPDRLPAGELRERLETVDGTASVRHGLGVLTATGAATFESRREAARLIGELGRGAAANSVWPLQPELQAGQAIPGLDQAPVLVFLLVILLFSITIGPVNFFLLRRAKRPMLALVTVPAIGFGTTLLMFGYAIVHDGFGVRGVERSWTLLDQANREAATVVTRSLFAGLSPGPLTVGSDSMLLAAAAFERPDRRSRHRWSYDGETGRIGGGVLPARTPTVLASARQGVARERLRAQVRTDGDLDLLTDGGVVPVGEVLLRDHEGRYWHGQSPRLAPLGARDAAGVLEKLARAFEVHLVSERHGPRLAALEGLSRALLGNGLPPGSYATRVAAAPWVPDHDLDVDYEGGEHFVIGRLGGEDFVE